MVEHHAFIFLGSDAFAKQERIETLQKKIFPPGLKELNYTVLYGSEKKLKPRELKSALRCLPTEGVKKRLVLIRMAHKLTKVNQACLLEELRNSGERTIIILDVPEAKGTEDFVSEFIKAGAQLLRFKSEVQENVFDLGREIMRRRPETALKILSGLLGYRERTEKILGAIFWQWEYSRSQNGISESKYKKGLKFLLDADKKFKSSSSAYARETLILEALVVKLAYLA